MKSVSELLTNAIPTKWSQAIAVLTIASIPLAYNVPSLLPPTWLPNSQEQIFLIRLLLSLLSVLAGSLTILSLVIRAYNELVKNHEKEIAEITKPSPQPPSKIKYNRKYLA